MVICVCKCVISCFCANLHNEALRGIVVGIKIGVLVTAHADERSEDWYKIFETHSVTALTSAGLLP